MADARVRVAAMLENPGDVRERFDVVHERRPAEEAVRRGIRRPRPHLRTHALERVQQRRLLAADIAAAPGHDLESKASVRHAVPRMPSPRDSAIAAASLRNAAGYSART